MLIPLVLLAIFAIGSGWSFVAGSVFGLDTHHTPHPHGLLIPVLATAMGVIGAGLGFLIYNGKTQDPISIPLLANKFGLDEFYAKLVAIFQDAVAYVSSLATSKATHSSSAWA